MSSKTTNIEIECPCDEKCKFTISVGIRSDKKKDNSIIEVECECCEELLEIELPGQSDSMGNVNRNFD